METFYDTNFPGKPVTYTDPVLNVSGSFYLEGDFEWTPVPPHPNFNYKLTLVEV